MRNRKYVRLVLLAACAAAIMQFGLGLEFTPGHDANPDQTSAVLAAPLVPCCASLSVASAPRHSRILSGAKHNSVNAAAGELFSLPHVLCGGDRIGLDAENRTRCSRACVVCDRSPPST